MNVPLLHRNWSARAAIGCGAASRLRLAGPSALASYGPLSICLHILKPSSHLTGGGCPANHNKLCKRGLRLTMRMQTHCLGPAHLILTQACLMRPCPVLLLFSCSPAWPDKPTMKINDPTLTDSGGNWRAKEVVYHPVTGAIQSRSRPGYRPHAFSFLFCFCSPFIPSPLRSNAAFNNSSRFKSHSSDRGWHENKKINRARVRGRRSLTPRHSALIWIWRLRAGTGRHLLSIIHYNLPITPTLGIITAGALMINPFICRVIPSGFHS